MPSEPETEVEWSKTTLRATAIQRFGRREVRCRIEHDTWGDSGADVGFASRFPDEDLSVLGDWSTECAGRLSGPRSLQRWLQYMAVFEAALEAFTGEIDGEISYGQAVAYLRYHDEPHPALPVDDRPWDEVGAEPTALEEHYPEELDAADPDEIDYDALARQVGTTASLYELPTAPDGSEGPWLDRLALNKRVARHVRRGGSIDFEEVLP